MNSLTADKGLWKNFVPLVFHVDYWNYLGWKDPLSSGLYVDTWRTNYAGIVPDDYLNQLSYEKRELMWRSIIDQNEAGSHCLVALSDGEVVGFSSGGKNRDLDSTGELYAIYLRAQWQRTGLGRQLFRQSFQILKNDGFSNVQLWALEDNPACRFYRRDPFGAVLLRVRGGMWIAV